jgi:hypothetical protein
MPMHYKRKHRGQHPGQHCSQHPGAHHGGQEPGVVVPGVVVPAMQVDQHQPGLPHNGLPNGLPHNGLPLNGLPPVTAALGNAFQVAMCPQAIDPCIDFMAFLALSELKHCLAVGFVPTLTRVSSGRPPVLVIVSHSVPARFGSSMSMLRHACTAALVPVVHALDCEWMARACGFPRHRSRNDAIAVAIVDVPAENETLCGVLKQMIGRAATACEEYRRQDRCHAQGQLC